MDHECGDDNSEQLYELKNTAEQLLLHGGFPGGPNVVHFINTLTEFNIMYLDLEMDQPDKYLIKLDNTYKFHLREFFNCEGIESKLHHTIIGYTTLIELVDLIRVQQTENYLEDLCLGTRPQDELDIENMNI